MERNTSIQKCGEILVDIKSKNKKNKIYIFQCTFCDIQCDQLKKFSLHIGEEHLNDFDEILKEAESLKETEILKETELKFEAEPEEFRIPSFNDVEDTPDIKVFEIPIKTKPNINPDPLDTVNAAGTSTNTDNLIDEIKYEIIEHENEMGAMDGTVLISDSDKSDSDSDEDYVEEVPLKKRKTNKNAKKGRNTKRKENTNESDSENSKEAESNEIPRTDENLNVGSGGVPNSNTGGFNCKLIAFSAERTNFLSEQNIIYEVVKRPRTDENLNDNGGPLLEETQDNIRKTPDGEINLVTISSASEKNLNVGPIAKRTKTDMMKTIYNEINKENSNPREENNLKNKICSFPEETQCGRGVRTNNERSEEISSPRTETENLNNEKDNSPEETQNELETSTNDEGNKEISTHRIDKNLDSHRGSLPEKTRTDKVKTTNDKRSKVIPNLTTDINLKNKEGSIHEKTQNDTGKSNNDKRNRIISNHRADKNPKDDDSLCKRTNPRTNNNLNSSIPDKLRCSICKIITFSTVSNMRRHYLRIHNIVYESGIKTKSKRGIKETFSNDKRNKEIRSSGTGKNANNGIGSVSENTQNDMETTTNEERSKVIPNRTTDKNLNNKKDYIPENTQNYVGKSNIDERNTNISRLRANKNLNNDDGSSCEKTQNDMETTTNDERNKGTRTSARRADNNANHKEDSFPGTTQNALDKTANDEINKEFSSPRTYNNLNRSSSYIPDNEKLSCSICKIITFSNMSNKRRHYLRIHNVAYGAAKKSKKRKHNSSKNQ